MKKFLKQEWEYLKNKRTRFDWYLHKRNLHHFKQRLTQGFDDSETWSLFSELAIWFVPRLKRLREISPGTPGGLTHDEWMEILDKMIIGFEHFEKEHYGTCGWSDQITEEKQEALDLFSEWFGALWW